MLIKNLSLTNFRIFNRLEVEFPDSLSLLTGNNAQGKTSVMEAIHFISLLTSPIASHDREVINFSSLNDLQPVSRLVASIEKEKHPHWIEIRLILVKNNTEHHRLMKEVLIDGKKRRLYEAVGFFNSVLFLPQMTRIIEDGPEKRRNYLNQILSQVNSDYIRDLSEFQQGVLRRNALLKQLSERGGDQEQLLFWDELLAKKGAHLMHARFLAVKELNELVNKAYIGLTREQENMELVYLPSFDFIDDSKHDGITGAQLNLVPDLLIDEIYHEYLIQLLDKRREEIRRGFTTVGPHRDDLLFIADKVNLGIYGSRGQIRTAVLALKFAEMYWLEKKIGEKPVLLLDETLAEIDPLRRQDFLKVLENGSQAILTTADLGLFYKNFLTKCKIWEIKKGSLTLLDE